jgi:hypothetical protein
MITLMLPGQSKTDSWSLSVIGLRGVIRGEAIQEELSLGRVSTNLSRQLDFSRSSFIILVLSKNYQR